MEQNKEGFNMNFFLIQIIILVIFVLNNIECRNFRTQKISDSEFFSHSLKTNQGLRTYYVHTPFNQKSLKHPLPVILALHGRLGSGKQIMKESGFNELADKESFIVVYPDGFERSWADGRGNTPADKNNVDDVGFLKLVLEKVSQDYSVDKRNYFIVGHSNGGFMTQRMLLEESNLFKAGVSVSSQLSLFLLKNYIPKSPVSIALIAGTEDPLVPFYCRYVQYCGELLSVEDSIDRWKEWNFCPSNGLE
jgi:polyhydroxybutyrate depolymerase